MELTNVTTEMMYRFKEYVEKTGTDWIGSALEDGEV